MPQTPAHIYLTWIHFWKDHGVGKLVQQNWSLQQTEPEGEGRWWCYTYAHKHTHRSSLTKSISSSHWQQNMSPEGNSFPTLPFSEMLIVKCQAHRTNLTIANRTRKQSHNLELGVWTLMLPEETRAKQSLWPSSSPSLRGKVNCWVKTFFRIYEITVQVHSARWDSPCTLVFIAQLFRNIAEAAWCAEADSPARQQEGGIKDLDFPPILLYNSLFHCLPIIWYQGALQKPKTLSWRALVLL